MNQKLIFSFVLPFLLMISSFSAYGFEEPASLIQGGIIEGYGIEENFKALIIEIKTFEDGEVTVKLARTTIDAKLGNADDIFFVIVGDVNELEETSFEEESTSTHRTLTIPFSAGDTEIWIIGTMIDDDGYDQYLGQKERECKKAVDADDSLTYAEKVVKKRDCETETRRNYPNIAPGEVTETEERGPVEHRSPQEIEQERYEAEKRRLESVGASPEYAVGGVEIEVQQLKDEIAELKEHLAEKDELIGKKDAVIMEQVKVISDLAKMIRQTIFEPFLNYFSIA